MIPANQVKPGMVLKIDSRLYAVLSYSHTKPGKGGAFLRIKLKDILTGQVLEKTISTAEKVDNVYVEERKLSYLYKDNLAFHFMDQQSYDDIILSQEELEDIKFYLKENDSVRGTFYEGKIVALAPEVFVNLKVVETEPGFKGDTVKSGTKPAKLETGLTLGVPLFIEKGDLIKVDTRTGEYVERV